MLFGLVWRIKIEDINSIDDKMSLNKFVKRRMGGQTGSMVDFKQVQFESVIIIMMIIFILIFLIIVIILITFIVIIMKIIMSIILFML
jgi:hypothetical protein